MRNRVAFAGLLAGIALTLSAMQVHAQAREEGQLLMATQILEELSATPDTFIPDRLLDRAYAIAVIPDVTKVAFIAGGRRGSGAMVVRDKSWSFLKPGVRRPHGRQLRLAGGRAVNRRGARLHHAHRR
jgi:lipid-binding SYLF domain-containing protein